MSAAAQESATAPSEDQERLAAELVACLGLEGAINACQANNWDGVLDILVSHGKGRDPGR